MILEEKKDQFPGQGCRGQKLECWRVGRGGVASSKLTLGLQTSEDRFRGRNGLGRVTKTGEPRARTKQGHCLSLSLLGSQLYRVALGMSWTALSPFCTADQGSSLAGSGVTARLFI